MWGLLIQSGNFSIIPSGEFQKEYQIDPGEISSLIYFFALISGEGYTFIKRKIKMSALASRIVEVMKVLLIQEF